MSSLDVAEPPLRAPIVRNSLPSWGAGAVCLAAAVAAVALLALTDVSLAVLVVGAVVLSGIVIYVWSRVVEGTRTATDRSVTFAVTSAFALALVPLVSVLYTVASRGLDRFDGQFFTESARNVVGEGGGGAHAILGTLVITGVATLASVPIGIMAAVYLREYGRGRLARALTFFVDVMTGIPSIVAGLFAYALFALFLGPGVRLGVVGAVALSVLMIPIVVRSTEEMLRIVPDHLREASYALGVPKWRTVTKVVLPTALAGIVTGVMVAVARIVGETAPLLITTGVFSSINVNPLDGRMENLAVFAYNEYKNPGVPPAPYLERAWAAALTLIAIVMVLNLVARLVYRRFGTDIR
ncbi:MAG: phosphate ABC transporter permease PstA [Actinomycetota bacterium]|nr:phosphate ABC transporter permease PstA [Actinomycetota bacterium]